MDIGQLIENGPANNLAVSGVDFLGGRKGELTFGVCLVEILEAKSFSQKGSSASMRSIFVLLVS